MAEDGATTEIWSDRSWNRMPISISRGRVSIVHRSTASRDSAACGVKESHDFNRGRMSIIRSDGITPTSCTSQAAVPVQIHRRLSGIEKPCHRDLRWSFFHSLSSRDGAGMAITGPVSRYTIINFLFYSYHIPWLPQVSLHKYKRLIYTVFLFCIYNSGIGQTGHRFPSGDVRQWCLMKGPKDLRCLSPGWPGRADLRW